MVRDFLTRLCVSVGIVCVLMSTRVAAIDITVEYSSGTLFYAGIDDTAKQAIDAAAADISSAITSTLDAITQDAYSSTFLSTTVTFDWSYDYRDPSTGAESSVESVIIPANTVTVFMGSRSFLGTTLGEGGPAVGNIDFQAIGFPNQSPNAADDAEMLSRVPMRRGGGPVINRAAGTWDWNGFTDEYSIDVGAAYGSVSLDYDRDNNGVRDSTSALDDYWHWNHNTPVGAGKNDLYSVALHEILHTLGIGASASWNDLVSGTTWNGSEVQAITGSGAGLVNPAGDHVASSLMSTRISDGSPQEVVMDPTITTGTRKELTVLDLAFLRDIGYETIMPVVYASADYNTDGDVDGGDLTTLENWYGVNANGDADNDGDTDGNDYLTWQRQYTGPIAPVAGVPEPTSAVLLAMGLALSCWRQPRRV